VKILREAELKREAARLLREGRMPSLQEFSRMMVEIRREYRLKILRARRESRAQRKEVVN
jgi:hypothetical protein